jgi:hypothetical protein
MVYSLKGVDMSMPGLGEASTQQLVYGPDGQVYNNPAYAKAAGVENPTNQPPLEAGIGEFERRQFLPYNQPEPMAMPKASIDAGSDPYSQITGQMGYGSDPYSQIMSQMPVRQNPYAYSPGGAIGGYDPALYNNAFVGSNSRLNLSGLIDGGGGGGGGMGGGGDSAGVVSSGGFSGPATYGSNQSLSNGLIGAMLGLSSQPSFDVTVENAGTYAGQPSYGYGSSMTGVGNPGESYGGGFTSSDTGVGNPGESYGGDSGGYGGTSSDTGSGNPGESDSGGYGGDSGGYGGGGDSFGGGEYNMGGLVDKVGGPNPAGPDDGTGMLQLGEYVIKKSAVKKYGAGLLGMINDGKIPAKKMKSLLG